MKVMDSSCFALAAIIGYTSGNRFVRTALVWSGLSTHRHPLWRLLVLAAVLFQVDPGGLIHSPRNSKDCKSSHGASLDLARCLIELLAWLSSTLVALRTSSASSTLGYSFALEDS